ncbi:MAG: ketoacyl-ACP synthase III [Saprospiraceae bacterium]|nr:ketoacyl-ACP synthase III [Saprospiraceae bacterium]
MSDIKTKIAGIGYYVPENVVTNFDLMEVMDTSDEWIETRTGIKERRYATRMKETTATMGVKAAKIAMERAGVGPEDIDFVIFATLSPDYYFPGCGVLVQRELGLGKIGALDVRNQCSGFIYGMSIADQFIRTGTYKNILLVGGEMHSAGIDFSTRGRGVTVIFGDGAGAVVLQPTTEENKGILTSNLHSDGRYAEKLAFMNPGSHGGVFTGKTDIFDEEEKYGKLMVNDKMVEEGDHYPNMEGPFVFKNAVRRFPETICESLEAAGYELQDLDMLIPHQANLRISQFVQKMLEIPDEKVYNNIQKYGNTTAASIPIALCEAWEKGKIKDGDLVCLAAFGSGFTWGSVLLRW